MKYLFNNFGPRFGEKDKVGCGIDHNRRIFFTLNGEKIGMLSAQDRTNSFVDDRLVGLFTSGKRNVTLLNHLSQNIACLVL